MKKVTMFLIIAFFIGRMSLEMWKKIPQEEFLDSMGKEVCERMNCENATIEARRVGENMYIFWECIDPKSTPEKKIKEKAGTNL